MSESKGMKEICIRYELQEIPNLVGELSEDYLPKGRITELNIYRFKKKKQLPKKRAAWTKVWKEANLGLKNSREISLVRI